MIKKMFVLDTDLIIDLLRGHLPAEPFFDKIKSREFLAYFSTITEAELFSGKTASTPEEQKILDDLFELMARIDVDKQVARKAGELIRKYGIQIADATIAASAIIYKIPFVATKNKRDYENIKEITILTPY